MKNDLIKAGALRQFLSNTGEGSYITAYDLEITNRMLAHLEIEKAAQGGRIEQDARIIEILRAQVERLKEQQNGHRSDFLLNGVRFKLNFSSRGNTDVFHNYATQLQGRWVALVPAEDDGHLASPPTIDTPEFQRLLDEAYGASADARQLGNDHGTADALGRAESKLIEHITTRIEAEVERRCRAQRTTIEESKVAAEDARPDDIRAAGWTVAVHNDYRLNGKAHTFWLFTRAGRAIKGEGTTDAEALAQVRAAITASDDTTPAAPAEKGDA